MDDRFSPLGDPCRYPPLDKMKTVRMLCLLVFFPLVLGCNTSHDETRPRDDGLSPPGPSGATLIILAIEQGSLKPTTKANVSAEELESQLGSVDWTQRPIPQFSLSRGGFENLNILAERTSPDSAILVWSTVKNGTPIKLKFGPIDPKGEETLGIFLSYLNQDGQHENMVKWRENLNVKQGGG